MDYDETDIATTYDKARAVAPETLRLRQDLLSAHIDRATISLVIDLGCGTGRFSASGAIELARDRVGLLAGCGLFPFEKIVDRHQAAPPLERLAEGGLGLDLLGPGIDGREADLDVLRPVRN
jgi:SAM-dependent methyltransferase